MFLTLEAGVYDNPEDFGMALRIDICPLMMKGSEFDLYGLQVKYVIAVFSASNIASLLLSQFSASLMITLMPSRLLCYGSGDPCREVVNECNSSFTALDSSLDQVRFEEEEQDGRVERALRQASMWQTLGFGGLTVNLDRRCAL